jgi:hypothetical protein
LLNRILADPKKAYEEALDEFLTYWAIGQVPVSRPVLIGEAGDGVSDAECHFIGKEPEHLVLVSNSADEVKAIASVLGGGTFTTRSVACWLFQTTRRPVLVGTGLPATIGDFFKWLKEWDAELYKDICYRLEHDQKYLAKSAIYFIIDSPYGRFGARLALDDVHRVSLKRKPALYKQYLHVKGQSTKVARLSVSEIGTSFIHSRNLSHGDLRSKRITVVGCGSIGGYVAQGLVRLGAGTGVGGLLTLVDPDSLGSENLGRHCLGLGYLFKDKAVGLRDELLHQFPCAKIEANVGSARPLAALFNEHLIVNATGEEAVSEMLNEYHVRRMQAGGRRSAEVVHTWIKGAGECVQALWVDSLKFACYRCRKNPDAPPNKSERHKVLKAETQLKFVGCQAVTPYAVSAPMSAAALVLDMTAAWINGDVSPRFRTRAVETADVFKVPNKDLDRIDGCPACSTKS